MMASDELDLSVGDEKRADAAQARTEKRASGSRSSKSRTTAASKQAENSLNDRLKRVFGRIAEALEKRSDPELAAAIKEDTEVMASSLVSLTRHAPFTRNPLLLLLGLVEPFLAFGRVAGILLRRFAERRALAQQAAQEAAQADTVVTGN